MENDRDDQSFLLIWLEERCSLAIHPPPRLLLAVKNSFAQLLVAAAIH